jgi:cyanate permease
VAAFTRAVGLVVAGTQVTYAFAPLVIGVLRDIQGDYQIAWWLCAGIDLTAAAVILIRR